MSARGKQREYRMKKLMELVVDDRLLGVESSFLVREETKNLLLEYRRGRERVFCIRWRISPQRGAKVREVTHEEAFFMMNSRARQKANVFTSAQHNARWAFP